MVPTKPAAGGGMSSWSSKGEVADGHEVNFPGLMQRPPWSDGRRPGYMNLPSQDETRDVHGDGIFAELERTAAI